MTSRKFKHSCAGVRVAAPTPCDGSGLEIRALTFAATAIVQSDRATV